MAHWRSYNRQSRGGLNPRGLPAGARLPTAPPCSVWLSSSFLKNIVSISILFHSPKKCYLLTHLSGVWIQRLCVEIFHTVGRDVGPMNVYGGRERQPRPMRALQGVTAVPLSPGHPGFPPECSTISTISVLKPWAPRLSHASSGQGKAKQSRLQHSGLSEPRPRATWQLS